MILFQIMVFAIVAVWICFNHLHGWIFKLDTNNDVLIPSIRVGLIITFLSMGMAFTMTQPSKQDIQKAEQNKGPIGLVMGSHSVGETDETKRLPLTSWAMHRRRFTHSTFYWSTCSANSSFLWILISQVKI